MHARYLPSAAAALVMVAALSVTDAAQAQDAANFPSKPISLIVPWGAGGSGDTTTRRVAERASAILGQPIVVENKPGGAGVTGTVLLAKAAPDGYTIGFGTWSPFTIVPHVRDVPYDTKADFTWIMQFGAVAHTFSVLSTSPWKTFPEFIEAARKAPGTLSYSTPGPLSGQTVLLQTIFKKEGVDVTFVPVSGGNEGDTRLLGGHIDAMASPSLGEYIRKGTVRPLMHVQPRERLASMPDVPTHYELGYQLDSPDWYGIFGPKGIDPAIVSKLEAAFMQACQEESFSEFMTNINHFAVCKPSAEFEKQVMSDFDSQGAALSDLIAQGLIKRD